MNKVTRNIAALIAIGTTSIGFAQVTQQKIGNNPTLINPNAALEVESTDKGILLPRVGLTATNSFAPLTSHVEGMTVYNTATAGAAPNNVTPGYYYNDGTQWVRVATGTDAKTEPWYQQNTSNEATANTDNIYQTGSVAIGKNEVQSNAALDVEGAVRGGSTQGTSVVSGTVGPNSVAFGTGNTASGIGSVALGGEHVASGDYSTTLGWKNEASGFASSAFGENNLTTEGFGMTWGQYNTNSGLHATTFGQNNTNSGYGATVFGYYNIGSSANQLIFGRYNAITGGSIINWIGSEPLLQIGNGSTELNRSNALTILKDGKIGIGSAIAPTENFDVGSGNVRIRDINTNTGAATDNIVVADVNGVLKTVPMLSSVNIYNADGLLTGTETDRNLGLNGKALYFNGVDRRTEWDSDGRIHQTATNTAMDAAMGFHNGDANLYIQQWSGDSAITASDSSTALSLGTHATQVSAPIVFNTSTGGGALGTEKMRITGTGNVGVNTPDPTEKFDNDGITRLRNLPLNGAVNAINTTVDGDLSAAQNQTFTATRTVVADANGVLGTVAGLPATPVNIYNANGTLTADRTVTTGSNFLRFTGNGSTVSITNTATQGRLSATGPSRGSIGIDGGSGASNSSLELYADANGVGQINAGGTGSTGLSVGTSIGSATPVQFKTNGTIKMTLTAAGELAIGAPAAPSFVIGGSTIQPKLHVAGDISTTGKLWTTNSVYADYVFEKYFKGYSDLNKEYQFNSLEDVKEFIKKNHHLPGVTKISDLTKSENGYTFDMTALSIQQLEKIEELFLHTIEQQAQLKTQYELNEQQQELILKQQDELQQLKGRMQKLEQLLNTKL